MDTGTEQASGMISKILPGHRKNPLGLIHVLTPLSLRGEQLSFSFDDVELSPREKQYLSVGMIMNITIDHSRAIKVKPKPVAEYQGSVVRGPQARASGHGFIVTLEPALFRVKISADSYNLLKLERPPLPGDFCTVRIPWMEMLLAAEENRMIMADIVSLIRRPPRLLAASSETLDSDGEESAVESKSESLTDLRSYGSHSDTYDDERSSSPDSIPDYAYRNDPYGRQRSKSFDGWGHKTIPASQPDHCSPTNGQYEEYDRFVQANLRRSMSPHVQEAYRGLPHDEALMPMNYGVGICRPSQAALAAFPYNHRIAPFNHQIQYQYHQRPFAMCCTHGYFS